MSGILSKVLGYNPNEVDVGLEASSVNYELEYGFFVKVNNEVLKALIERFSSNVSQVIFEGKLPGVEGIRPRIRKITKDKEISYLLETKVNQGDGKLEYTDVINEVNFKALVMACTTKNIRMRIDIPITKEDQPIKRKDGSDLKWELDLYLTGKEYSPWIKFDLEVDDLEQLGTDVAKYIPVEYETLYNAKTEIPEEREVITSLYQGAWNYQGDI
jgi:hypothetical protein